MNDLPCCASTHSEPATACPKCGETGRPVKQITLKALLKPAALTTFDPGEALLFCRDAGCDVVYFAGDRTYLQADVKVPVYQKNPGAATPLCYCFDHTRADLERAVLEGRAEAITQSIRGHIKAGRCGCEVNNPQGTCCLGNVQNLVALLQAAEGNASANS